MQLLLSGIRRQSRSKVTTVVMLLILAVVMAVGLSTMTVLGQSPPLQVPGASPPRLAGAQGWEWEVVRLNTAVDDSADWRGWVSELDWTRSTSPTGYLESESWYTNDVTYSVVEHVLQIRGDGRLIYGIVYFEYVGPDWYYYVPVWELAPEGWETDVYRFRTHVYDRYGAGDTWFGVIYNVTRDEHMHEGWIRWDTDNGANDHQLTGVFQNLEYWDNDFMTYVTAHLEITQLYENGVGWQDPTGHLSDDGISVEGTHILVPGGENWWMGTKTFYLIP